MPKQRKITPAQVAAVRMLANVHGGECPTHRWHERATTTCALIQLDLIKASPGPWNTVCLTDFGRLAVAIDTTFRVMRHIAEHEASR